MVYGVHNYQLARFNRDVEDPLDRRLRERKEAEESKQQRQQHQVAANSAAWDTWFVQKFESVMVKTDGPFWHPKGMFMAAMGEVLAEIRKGFEQKIGELQTQVKELQQQLSFNNRFNELERDLAARQMALTAAKRGAQGEHGVRGARGERGPRGDRGPAGPPGLAATQITLWKIDKEHYRAVPLYSDSSFGPPIDLYPLFERFLIETRD